MAVCSPPWGVCARSSQQRTTTFINPVTTLLLSALPYPSTMSAPEMPPPADVATPPPFHAAAQGDTGRCCGYAHDEALTSTGSTRTRHRSASASRALCINPRNFQLCPETRRHAAVTRPCWCRPSHLTGGRERLPSWALHVAPLDSPDFERGVRARKHGGRARYRSASRRAVRPSPSIAHQCAAAPS